MGHLQLTHQVPATQKTSSEGEIWHYDMDTLSILDTGDLSGGRFKGCLSFSKLNTKELILVNVCKEARQKFSQMK